MKKFRIVVVTQDDPFYLARNFDYFLSILPEGAEVVACVLLEVSPFGKKNSFLGKMKQTYETFGLPFFVRYGIRYVLSKLNPGKKIARVCAKWNIPIITLTENINRPGSLQQIGAFEPDLLISITANQIFRKPVLELAPKGVLNLHTALLPKYRGILPTFWVLRFDEKMTGVSVFFVDEGIDSGPILVQKPIEVGDRSWDELIVYTKKIGMEAMAEAVGLVMKGDYKLIPNPNEDQSYYSFPKPEDVKAFLAAGKRLY